MIEPATRFDSLARIGKAAIKNQVEITKCNHQKTLNSFQIDAGQSDQRKTDQ